MPRHLRSDTVQALATGAATAAHELGSPLNTLAVLVDEIAQDHADDPRLQRDMALMAQQLALCRQILQRMAAVSAGPAAPPPRERLDAVLLGAVQRVQRCNPRACVLARLDIRTPVPRVRSDERLQQALVNLLQNAVDASPQQVQVQADWSGSELRVQVLDEGPGIDPALLPHLGQHRVVPGQLGSGRETGRETGQETGQKAGQDMGRWAGLGLGLVLSAEGLAQLGGGLSWANRPGRGVCAELRLPLAALEAQPPTPAAPAHPEDTHDGQ